MLFPTNEASDLSYDFIAYLATRFGLVSAEAASVLEQLLVAYEPVTPRPIEILSLASSSP